MLKYPLFVSFFDFCNFASEPIGSHKACSWVKKKIKEIKIYFDQMKSRGLSHGFWDSQWSVVWFNAQRRSESSAVFCAAVLERLDWQFPWLPESAATGRQARWCSWIPKVFFGENLLLFCPRYSERRRTMYGEFLNYRFVFFTIRLT